MDKKMLKLLGFEKIKFTDAQKKLFTNLKGELFDIVTYLPKDYVEDILLHDNLISRYIFIEHNKTDDLYDKKEDYLKKVHIHIVINCVGKRRASSICHQFNTTEVRRIDTTEQYVGSILYLTHESKKAIAQGKVKYEKSSLISNDIDYFNDVLQRPRKTNQALEIIDKLLMGIGFRELVTTYGRDFVYHYKQYNEMAKLLYLEDNREYKEIQKILNNKE